MIQLKDPESEARLDLHQLSTADRNRPTHLKLSVGKRKIIATASDIECALVRLKMLMNPFRTALDLANVEVI